MNRTIVLLFTLVLGIAFGFVVRGRLDVLGFGGKEMRDAAVSTWPVYSDVMANNGAGYSFSYPADFMVTSQKSGNTHTLTIVADDAAETSETPAMRILVSNAPDNASIEFSLWEGMAWDYYDEVVESFQVQN